MLGFLNMVLFHMRNGSCFSILIVVAFSTSFVFLLIAFSRDESYTKNDELMKSRKSLHDRFQQLSSKINMIIQQSSLSLQQIQKPNETIYTITATYYRLTQIPDLVRLSQTFRHVENFHWIVVEDAEEKSERVKLILEEYGMPSTHLAVRTHPAVQLKNNQKRYMQHRGVEQRNRGLLWIRQHIDKQKAGVVYFADDDNTYHLKLFDEMRTTKHVSMWPVGIVGKLRWEGPVCKDGKVTGFVTAFAPQRAFPIDMAGFAVNLRLILEAQHVYISLSSLKGYLESDFLKKMNVTLNKIEAKANDCSRILQNKITAKPPLKNASHFAESLSICPSNMQGQNALSIDWTASVDGMKK